MDNKSNELYTNPPIFVKFKDGHFTVVEGEDIRGPITGSERKSSLETFKFPYDVQIECNTTYGCRVTFADENYLVTNSTASINGLCMTIPADTIFRISLGTTSDTDEQINQKLAITPLINKFYAPVNWLALGDSITQGWYSYIPSGSSDSSSSTDPSRTWAGKVAKINGWKLTNLARGGMGFIDPAVSGDNTTSGYYLVRGTDFTPYNLVTIAFGINDWKANRVVGSVSDAPTSEAPTTVMQAMRDIIENIMLSNPNCKIIVITPLNCVGYSYSYGTKETNYGLNYPFSNSGTLNNFVKKMIEVCDYYGVEYIDQTHYSCINRENLRTMLPDGIHPSLEAHELLARELSKKINF